MASEGRAPEAGDGFSRAYTVIAVLLGQVFLVQLAGVVLFVAASGVLPFGSPKVVVLTVNAIAVVNTVVGLAMVRSVFRAHQAEVEAKVRLEALDHLKEMLNAIRAQRHDFRHHLQTVYGLITFEDLGEAREYLEKVLKDVRNVQALVVADNLALTAMLRTKMGIAEARGVELDVEIQGSLLNLPLLDHEANAAIGNLVDNAIEAVLGRPEPDRLVDLRIENRPEGLYVKVSDNGPGLPEIDIETLFAGGFSTKGEERGIGLSSVRGIVYGAGGTIDVNRTEEGFTEFVVWVPKRGRA